MTSLMTGPSTPGLHLVYIPAVCLLIVFQGYYSQYLFSHDPELSPGPLTRQQTVTFNLLLAILWWTYYLACTVDPGRYLIPRRPTSSSSSPSVSASAYDSNTEFDLHPKTTLNPTRHWCKKCRRPKPLRAHHCRHCGRCIPKMDHHCPWTGNCVSMQTFPYFLRFLLYTNIALLYLARLIWQRAGAIWASRHLPAYLGPSVGSLIGLTVLALVNAGTILALGILFYTTVKGWVFNCTMIEEWEIERHEAVLARLDEDHRRGSDGYFWGDYDETLRERLERIEFPYDVGVFANMAQAMGTWNVLRWFLPVFGGGPRINNETPGKGTGWEWEENGFNDLPGLWPPPDPEKMRQAKRGGWPGAMQQPEGRFDEYQTPEEMKAAFVRRQQEDFLRRRRAHARQAQQRSGIIAELEEVDELPGTAEGSGSKNHERTDKPSWTNSDGDRLWDYGVDEEVEEEIVPTRVDDDDDVPLAELIRKRKVLTREEDG